MNVAKSTRLRAVLDTNVYFSAFLHSEGVPFEIWQQALNRQFTLLVSAAIISLEVVKADPDDDKILECAVEGSADLIVSGDRHLTRLKSFRGIGIVRPIDFHRTFKTFSK